jgi:hypothetical protein
MINHIFTAAHYYRQNTLRSFVPMILTTTLSRLSSARIKPSIISDITTKLNVDVDDPIPYSDIARNFGVTVALEIAEIADRQFDYYWRLYVLGLMSKIMHLLPYPNLLEALNTLARFNEGLAETDEVTDANKKVWEIKTKPCHIKGWSFEGKLDSSFSAWNALQSAISPDLFGYLGLLRYHFRNALTMECAENAVRGLVRNRDNRHVWNDAVEVGQKAARIADNTAFLDAVGYKFSQP